MEMLENKNNIVIISNYDYITEKNIIDLWSYNSHIASFINYNKKNNCMLKLNREKWDYSQTTLKHLKHFINDYIEKDYYTTKKEFDEKIKKNGFIYLVNECDL